MAKIGVVTLSKSVDNYGNVLQYLATQEFLNQRGHVTYLLHTHGHEKSLNLKWLAIRLHNKIMGAFLHLKNIIKTTEQDSQKKQIFRRWAEVTIEREKLHPRYFSNFRRDYFKIVEGTYEDILSRNFDVYCVGSDQAWSSENETYMLGWVPNHFKKISFATSVGHKKFSNTEINRIKKKLKSFELITVREQNAKEMAEACGITDAELILDPTFLLSSSQYDRFLPQSANISKRPYVLLYMLGGEVEVSVHQIITDIGERGYNVKYVESQGRDENEKKEFPTIEEWLELVKNAAYIVTNSFHGMAFSIIYHKPFLVFPLIGVMSEMNVRIENLADYFNVRHRIYRGDFDVLFENMNWGEIEKKKMLNYTRVDALLVAHNL